MSLPDGESARDAVVHDCCMDRGSCVAYQGREQAEAVLPSVIGKVCAEYCGAGGHEIGVADEFVALRGSLHFAWLWITKRAEA